MELPFFRRLGGWTVFNAKMKNITIVLALSLFPLTANAALNANMTVTSDYILRGISNSQHKPALQGAMSFVHDTGLYAGTYASTVDFNDGKQASYEWDAFFGHTGKSDTVNWDAGLLFFTYPGAAKSLQYDGYKYRVEARHAFSFATLGAYYDHIPDYLGSGIARYLEGLAIIPLPGELSLDMRLGRQRISNNALLGLSDFTYRSIALQKRSGSWDMSLGWQSNGLSAAECFAGQNWCRESVNILFSRNFTLLDGH